MARPLGHGVRLGRGRRLVIDFLHASRRCVMVAVERQVNIAEVVAARESAHPRPGWYSVLLKAYGLAAREVPELRRSLFTFPYTRLHEHPESAALVTVERELDGVPSVLTYVLRRPESKPLLDIDAELARLRTAPLHEVTAFRRALRLLWFPRPVRRFLLWLGLHVSGRWRSRFAGTFTASNVAPFGGALTLAFCPHTTFFAPAPIEEDGSTTLRVFFDHRATDGAPIARALVALEEALRGPILEELRSLAPPLRVAV